eukprot:7803904-Pyramimonas_sp.AAC.1
MIYSPPLEANLCNDEVLLPGRPRDPVAEPIIVLDVAYVYELVVVARDVHPAVDVVAPASGAPLAVL